MWQWLKDSYSLWFRVLVVQAINTVLVWLVVIVAIVVLDSL